MGLIQSNFINGIPLEVASSILPLRSKFNIGVLAHIFLHSKKITSTKSSQKQINREMKFSYRALKGLCTNLEHTIKKLDGRVIKSDWVSYYSNNTYSSHDFQIKQDFLSEILSELKPEMTWDLGCNIGEFSHIASKYSNYVLSIDNDHSCIEKFTKTVLTGKLPTFFQY